MFMAAGFFCYSRVQQSHSSCQRTHWMTFKVVRLRMEETSRGVSLLQPQMFKLERA